MIPDFANTASVHFCFRIAPGFIGMMTRFGSMAIAAATIPAQLTYCLVLRSDTESPLAVSSTKWTFRPKP
jgi:hypothetical protein